MHYMYVLSYVDMFHMLLLLRVSVLRVAFYVQST